MAVSVADCPVHSNVAEEFAETDGTVCVVTDTVSVSAQLAVAPVTVYTVFADGLIAMLLPV